MPAGTSGNIPYHMELLRDPVRMLEAYDASVQELLDVVIHEGYFNGVDVDNTSWPAGSREAGTIGIEGLRKRVALVTAIFHGVPKLREERLAEAYELLGGKAPELHEGDRLYLALKRQFVDQSRGTGRDFFKLYQGLYVEALKRTDLYAPDQGEAALENLRLSRVPLSHARSVAEALSAIEMEDLRWEDQYVCTLDGVQVEDTLRNLLQIVAERALNAIAAGELLSNRYNTYMNFGVFGSSFWKAVVEADYVLGAIGEKASSSQKKPALEADIRLAHAMMIEFFRAHTEDPSKLKPAGYWYGQEYSYLTRDMIDTAVRIVRGANAVIDETGADIAPVEVPPLMAGTLTGRFLEYPDSGRQGAFTSWQRGRRIAKWIAASWKFGRRKARLHRAGLPREELLREAWEVGLTWGRDTRRCFDIQVKVTVDPHFKALADELKLGTSERKILFLPTHQSLHDHPVLYGVLESSELLGAMGWERPEPCVILARTGLARAGVKIGPLDVTMFGMSSEKFDQMLAEVDGYITLERSGATGHTTQKVVEVLEERPGIIYPMATTAAFSGQVFPLQHALFAQLPEDVVIIPIALRGIHELWPKAPKGNMNISPGLVEAVIMPPVLGETTLMPRRRSLRIQLETSALFQAFHIAGLLNPEPR